MANERLRAALLTAGIDVTEAAVQVGVDRKTVERWIGGRKPYARHQYALASLLKQDVAYLWPDGRTPAEVREAGQAEVVAIYPHRNSVPRETFLELFGKAHEQLDVLVYSGLWLSEDQQFFELVRDKAQRGVVVRFLLGDPESHEVAQRGEDEGIGEVMAGKVRNVLVNYRNVRELPNVEFRAHSTVLYNSIYRADDEVLVNAHVYGFGAYMAPVMHLRRVPGADMVSTYLASLEKVWEGATRIPAASESAAA